MAGTHRHVHYQVCVIKATTIQHKWRKWLSRQRYKLPRMAPHPAMAHKVAALVPRFIRVVHAANAVKRLLRVGLWRRRRKAAAITIQVRVLQSDRHHPVFCLTHSVRATQRVFRGFDVRFIRFQHQLANRLQIEWIRRKFRVAVWSVLNAIRIVTRCGLVLPRMRLRRASLSPHTAQRRPHVRCPQVGSARLGSAFGA